MPTPRTYTHTHERDIKRETYSIVVGWDEEMEGSSCVRIFGLFISNAIVIGHSHSNNVRRVGSSTLPPSLCSRTLLLLFLSLSEVAAGLCLVEGREPGTQLNGGMWCGCIRKDPGVFQKAKKVFVDGWFMARVYIVQVRRQSRDRRKKKEKEKEKEKERKKKEERTF
ncbi:hypothetical protein B0F90DRAFT_1919178 [Multifurca ochricompacta]|uniref:Uncharacterized protein n=1 Tax=Multifurca ochricompacta TaxID=376703 RepID=A0AAD4M1E9_9AGAM|nr:hypothetical protein B0F90DRAFT_1919178 [Multifurca ochricompacta]